MIFILQKSKLEKPFKWIFILGRSYDNSIKCNTSNASGISMSLFFTFCVIQSQCVFDNYQKKVLIIGITGQDGFYLSNLLLSKGYEVHGLAPDANLMKDSCPLSTNNLVLHTGDISDLEMLVALFQEIKPDEIYNLAAQSNVALSFTKPLETTQINAVGVLNILEAIRKSDLVNKTRFFQASSAEMFGKTLIIPQDENTSFMPTSPYGVSKVFAYWITVNYRTVHKVFACNAILYNHESPIRPLTFVTRKITNHVAHYYHHKEPLMLGNLNAQRDWGYAEDYVEAMWLTLQQAQPNDYIISSGTTHSVREFVEAAFKVIGIDVIWQGQGSDEVGIDSKTQALLVKVDDRLFRPDEPFQLKGNAKKSHEILGWSPKTSFEELVKLMVKSDIEKASNEHT